LDVKLYLHFQFPGVRYTGYSVCYSLSFTVKYWRRVYQVRQESLSTQNCKSLFCFWTLSVVLFLFKTTRNVSETVLCLLLQVEPTQLSPIDRASPYLGTPAPSQSQSQSHVTTDNQSASPSSCQVPIWDPRPIFLSP
jgi:hypothetical protein